MDDVEWVSEQFRANRSRLEGIAYRMLGSRAEAEDAVQETWLRVVRGDQAAVENWAGWLTTVTGRICLDRLRSRQSRREELRGAGVPDLEDRSVERDPAQAALLADSVGAALLVVLDSMVPEERVSVRTSRRVRCAFRRDRRDSRPFASSCEATRQSGSSPGTGYAGYGEGGPGSAPQPR